MIRESLRRATSAVLAFGTQGLSVTEARQVHAATVGSLAVIAVTPFFTMLSLAQGHAFFSFEVAVTFLVNPALLAPYVALLKLGRVESAKIAYAIGTNLIAVFYAFLFSEGAGLYFYAFALAVMPFFLFDQRRGFLLAVFTMLPAVSFLVMTTYFESPTEGFGMPPNLLHQLWTLNFVSALFVTSIVYTVIFVMIRRAEDRLARFSGTVSEYLDASLVDRLRDGADVAPRLRRLTVFFSDLIGSTRTSFAMGKEAFGQMIDEYVREMQKIIKAHGGYIEDVSGDGILGYVGNFDSTGPKADAVAVVSMCVEMRRRLKALAPRFRDLYGLPGELRVRIGISSGEAMVGKTAGARAIYTANGDVVNLGAKLEKRVGEVSPNGGILVSRETADLLSGLFELEPHTLDIEGRSIETFLVIEPEALP